jgi:LPXTG-motif cell wall-anchored protein
MSTTRTGLLARALTSLAAGAALVVGPGVVSPAAAADAPTTTDERAGLAGSFIATTLIGGDHYDYPTGGFDGGNTVDAVLALDGAGVGSGTADAAMAYLAAHVGEYLTYDDPDLGLSTWAGPTAKTLLAVVAHGGDPTSFGGVDLQGTLVAMEGTVEPGRFSDDSPYGDFSNTIGQSLAMIALSRAGVTVDADATTFLLAQQCADGGFRGDPAAAGCVSDPDATAFAAQALLAVGSTAEAGAALDLLGGLQDTNGGIAGDGAPANANTTGVAVQAFLAAGRSAQATAGQDFIASLQYDCTAVAALRWGIAHDATTQDPTGPLDDTELRATPQAALALAGGSLLSVSADGATDALPTFACPAPTTSTPTTSTTTSGGTTTSSGSATTTASAPTSGSGGTTSSAPASETVGAAAGGSDPTPSATAAASGPASLAQTGSNALLPVLAGLALLVVGVLAVWGSRRRGAHA